MSVACQGLGASVWYPCKDHQSDEPEEGAQLTIQVPKDKNIIAIGNGRKVAETNMVNINNNNRFSWQVTNPINNYNIIPYIGHYVNWSDTLVGEKNKLSKNKLSDILINVPPTASVRYEYSFSGSMTKTSILSIKCLNISSLAKGTYLLKLSTLSGSSITKLVKE